MRKIIVLLSVALTLVGGWASASPADGGEAPTSLARTFTSVYEMSRASDLVVEVEVMTEPATIRYGGVLFALNRVKVQRVLKGPAGLAELNVLDNGGIFRGEEYAMGGMPLMHQKDRFLLFLYKYKGPVTDKDAYMITGVWQGKVRITPSGRLEFVGPTEEQPELRKELRRYKLETIFTQVQSSTEQ